MAGADVVHGDAVEGEDQPFGFDPYTDWADERRRELLQAGCALRATGNDAMARAWLNLMRRRIEPRPRAVLEAREFAPGPEERPPVQEIARRARAGGDLNPYLTKRSMRVDERDGLLFDWDLHHLHLGSALEASGFVRRTGRLLFVRVTDEAVFFIAIGRHGDWADQRLFEAMHANWPETLARHRLPRGAGSKPRERHGFAGKDRAALRRVGLTMMTQVADGTCYFPPGGGVTTDGTNLRVTQQLMLLRQYFWYLRSHVRENSDRIREAAWRTGTDPDTLRLHLVFAGAQPVAQDAGGRFMVWLPTFEAWQEAGRNPRSQTVDRPA